MRKIKFRAWDGHKMLNSPHMNDEFSSLYYAIENCIRQGQVLMQYTGRKDRDNKEIYEGDVLDNGHYKTQVYWNEHTCSWSHKSINLDDALYIYIATNTTLDQKLSFEIIGDIHENPKLLKSGK